MSTTRMLRTRRTAGTVLAVLLLAAAVACSSSKASSTDDTASTDTSAAAGDDVSVLPTAVSNAPARPSPGCSAPNTLDAGHHDLTLTVDGTERQYRLFIPSSATTGTPLPM